MRHPVPEYVQENIVIGLFLTLAIAAIHVLLDIAHVIYAAFVALGTPPG